MHHLIVSTCVQLFVLLFLVPTECGQTWIMLLPCAVVGLVCFVVAVWKAAKFGYNVRKGWITVTFGVHLGWVSCHTLDTCTIMYIQINSQCTFLVLCYIVGNLLNVCAAICLAIAILLSFIVALIIVGGT